MSLFNTGAPLAERCRPRTLSDFVGQEHLVAKGKPLRKMTETGFISSFLLWGPPGSGKTTIAKIVASSAGARFHQINAVSSGVKEVREIISTATNEQEAGFRTILFIDEIHRFNKAQQDALLSSVEKGVIILIGATTENPSFEVIPALRSRMRIFRLNELNEDNITEIVKRAIQNDSELKKLKIEEESTAYDYLYLVSGGDARSALNIVEAIAAAADSETKIVIGKDEIENIIQKRNIIYDKAGEEHFNIISAFIKSMRGSDPDAAIYWMARMIAGGEDPLFIARRMVVFASEDIGNASPNALLLAEAAFSAVDKIGMPEARIILAQCATYLAGAPKSNASYQAIDRALSDVEKEPLYAVPLHLRNAPTGYMKNIGYGSNYKYPHSYPGHFVKEDYLPAEMKGKQYFFPSDNGYEETMKERLAELWKGIKKYDK
ncbi:MAG: replication-associated recombination protein A [Ignavibacteriales bacterium]|nr:MAG: replication-associated recombination protein A [Ignavibacteriaceae bacterium]MBW7873219.1 replication-associated recombination protein A [Ignavibacteria bacterium]MCZ2142861.1 replication-associated recombination protein A [Ignavibacteriales bacterium]OQY70983.1 MAG: AAA family ATPase [Ignavibacteriales bacterium UTCHB3]MBV6443955.1 Replication-associated recombination protein A [Ignavibacteriaceae bacterium]